MKKLIYTLTLIILGTSVLLAQSNFHNIHYLDPYNPEYVKGEVLIKFKDEAKVESTFKSGIAKTGISSVDKILEPYQIEAIGKVFKETREQRQRKTVQTIRDFKGNEIEVPALFNIYKLKFDTIWDAKQIIKELQKDKNVEFAEPNYLVYTSEVMENVIIPDSPPVYTPLPSTAGDRNTYPNDPLYQDGSQWYLDSINAPAAWDSVTGDTTQIIAIIDTGVDWDHPDLDDNIWTNWDEIPDNGIDDDNNGYIDDTRGWDFINNDNDPNDDNSHGTHVAGIAAGEGNNGIGICGVAWNSKIMPVKMLQSSGSGNSSDLASAIEYASENGATVINMSLGSYGESLTVKSALELAYSTSLPVAAAGNDNLDLDNVDYPYRLFPACYSFVIGVQATNQNGSFAAFSNYDPSGPISSPYLEELYNYELMAPGVTIISTFPNGGYQNLNGTSMASPIVAGAVAMMQQFMPSQSKEQIFAKLIQSSNGGMIDIQQALNYILTPDLYYLDYTMLDTCTNCDNDGIPDAGETIDLYFSVKNAGGYADSVWSKIRFAPFEDTTIATIIDSNSYIGDISSYAYLTGESDHFQIFISPSTVNAREIFFEYEVGCKNSTTPVIGNIAQTIENGSNLLGMFDSTLILTSDKLWIVNGSFLVNGTLIINPGTKLILKKTAYFGPNGKLICNGTKDSLVEILKIGGGFEDVDTGYCNYTKFTYPNDAYISTAFQDANILEFDHCIFENVSIYLAGYSGSHSNCTNSELFHSHFVPQPLIAKYNNYDFRSGQPIRCRGVGTVTKFCNVYGTYQSSYPNTGTYERNNILSQCTVDVPNSETCKNVYWGTADTILIEERIHDFWYNASWGFLTYEPKLEQPSDSAHGCVWKVEINGIDPQDEILEPIGSGTYQFDVYFNKCMDTTYTPLLSFGVREPYTQKIVSKNSTWSTDSTIWTAYYDIGPETGDGINRIRVANAFDTAGFVIPLEFLRFKFTIQAAAAASIEFYATAGIGKVDLEWPPTPSEDALGYNLYRFYNLTDSTYSDTLMINSELILDTVYTDYNIIPDTTYHYLYKTLGTDMVETDYSKVASATPFNAANGDANGDLAVNVLDITTIVSYMLNENPTPFLHDAADVNYDDAINVLDIIGLVQLINGNKSVSTQPLPKISNEPAYYSIKDNTMQFESKGNVGALQFKLKVKSEKLKVKSEKLKVDKLRIFSLEKGFEFAYAVVDDQIVGILYSLTGKEIPEGTTELFRFKGIDINKIEVTEIFGGNLNGDYVPVLKKGENTEIFASDAKLQANPNPFTYSTQINYTVPENGIVEIRLFDMTGTEINNFENTYHNAGKYTINWNGTNDKGQLLKLGIYLLQLKVKSVSGNTYHKEVKLVLTK